MREMKDSSLWEPEIVISLALWDILCLGTKLCLIKSEAEILPLASRTLFLLSSQRNATFQLTVGVPELTSTWQLFAMYHLCISVYVVCLCRVFLRAGIEREKYFLSVKLNDSLMNSLQHRKALMYVLTKLFPHHHFVVKTINSSMNSRVLLAHTHFNGSYGCEAVILRLWFFFVYSNYF